MVAGGSLAERVSKFVSGTALASKPQLCAAFRNFICDICPPVLGVPPKGIQFFIVE